MGYECQNVSAFTTRVMVKTAATRAAAKVMAAGTAAAAVRVATGEGGGAEGREAAARTPARAMVGCDRLACCNCVKGPNGVSQHMRI